MMDDVKHTPGLWVVSKIGLMNDGGRPVVTDDVRVAIACAITEPAKARDAWQHHCEEREANARLIAAAPDFFDASPRAIEMLRIAAHIIREHAPESMHHYDCADCDGWCIADDCDAVAERLSDAIAKATVV